MKVNVLSVIVASVLIWAIVGLISGVWTWGIIPALVVAVGGLKWLRVKKRDENDEVEYDERVNQNIRDASLHTFAYSALFLLVYLIIADQMPKLPSIESKYLIVYTSLTLAVAFYIAPAIARRR